MEFPQDLKYTKEHEWVKIQDGIATMGITNFAQDELGEIVFVELPDVGKEIKQGDSVIVVESTKAASDVYAPIGGKVKETNCALTDNPELVNSSPYDEGWMVKFDAPNAADLDSLMTADEYKEFLKDHQ